MQLENLLLNLFREFSDLAYMRFNLPIDLSKINGFLFFGDVHISRNVEIVVILLDLIHAHQRTQLVLCLTLLVSLKDSVQIFFAQVVLILSLDEQTKEGRPCLLMVSPL